MKFICARLPPVYPVSAILILILYLILIPIAPIHTGLPAPALPTGWAGLCSGWLWLATYAFLTGFRVRIRFCSCQYAVRCGLVWFGPSWPGLALHCLTWSGFPS